LLPRQALDYQGLAWDVVGSFFDEKSPKFLLNKQNFSKKKSIFFKEVFS
jgi:hypothetical protein